MILSVSLTQPPLQVSEFRKIGGKGVLSHLIESRVGWKNEGQPPSASPHCERTVKMTQVISKGILHQHQGQLQCFE